MSRSLVYVNGKISPPESAMVSVFDRGFLFGDGVYETGKSYGRCPLFLEEHWARLRHSAEKLHIKLPWADDELTETLFKTASEFGADTNYFRTIVTRGVIDHVGLDVEAKNPTLVHLIQELSDPEQKRREGISLVTSTIVRNSAKAQDPNIKTSNYLNSLLALQDAKHRGGEDAILCDADGNVTEGTTFSVFSVTKDGTLRTPALSVGILDSITRRYILELASHNRKVEEGTFNLTEMQTCPEVFIASSVREIIPVRLWDGKVYGVDGPVTRELQERLKGVIRDYISNHAKF